jgi:co-chaperonin GroES (HSP10)
MSDTIPLDGVPAASLRLLNEDVLVRPAPMEEMRASGLFVPNTPSQNFLGGVFYGVVVAVGPGRLIEKTASADEVIAALEEALVPRMGCTLTATCVGAAEKSIRDLLARRQEGRRIPLPWKPGDHVACRQGFGPEVMLREGRHFIVGRGNSDYGHGVIASWEPGHTHCWHAPKWENYDPGSPDGKTEAECCQCPETKVIDSALPSCSKRTARVAEAILGGKVCEVEIPSDAGPGAYELRPEDDGRQDV